MENILDLADVDAITLTKNWVIGYPSSKFHQHSARATLMSITSTAYTGHTTNS